MPDVFTPAKLSDVMSRIRSRGNKGAEQALVSLYRQHKIRGWRRHVELKLPKVEVRKSKMKGIRGAGRQGLFKVRPDFVFSALKGALFVDGCFWHVCPRHATKPKSNARFWTKKLSVNQQRNRNVNRELRSAGCQVIRIWEHSLKKKNEMRLASRIKRFLGSDG